MVKINQNFTLAAGERRTVRFPVVDQDNSDAVLDNLDTAFDVVKWAMSPKNAAGEFSTSNLVVEKKSDVVQAETGGNEIDFSDSGGTLDAADVELLGADTASLRGEFFHELAGFDSTGEEVVLATGTMTIGPNLENT